MSSVTKLKEYSKFILLPLLVIFLAAVLVYFLINSPAYLKKAGYEYKTKIKGEDPASGLVFLPDIDSAKLKVKPEENTNEGELLDNYLYVSKIGVSAPIIWNVKEDEMIKELENGVTHLEGSKLPNQKGNIFITGHSSYYFWNKGKYKTVFALLPNLEAGDKIILTFNNQIYRYEVKKTMTVAPDQIEIINSSDHDELTLMTCVPVGTSISRFVVKADLIERQVNSDQPKRNAYKARNKNSAAIALLSSILF